MKLHLRGGLSLITFSEWKVFDTEHSDVDSEGNVLLLLQGEQGQVLGGQAHPSSGKWKDVRDVLLLPRGLECSPISVAVCELAVHR